jgi:hypothetical protein
LTRKEWAYWRPFGYSRLIGACTVQIVPWLSRCLNEGKIAFKRRERALTPLISPMCEKLQNVHFLGQRRRTNCAIGLSSKQRSAISSKNIIRHIRPRNCRPDCSRSSKSQFTKNLNSQKAHRNPTLDRPPLPAALVCRSLSHNWVVPKNNGTQRWERYCWGKA